MFKSGDKKICLLRVSDSLHILSSPSRELIVFCLERRDQSRVSSTSHWRSDVPRRRLIRDSADQQRSNWRTRRPQAIWEWKPELRRSNRRRSVSERQRKKNGEVNSPTPGSQCADGPHSLHGECGPSCFS